MSIDLKKFVSSLFLIQLTHDSSRESLRSRRRATNAGCFEADKSMPLILKW